MWISGHAWLGMGRIWAFAVIALVAVVVFVRWAARNRQAAGRPALSPEDILRTRYANGDIDDQEFRRYASGVI